MLAADDAAVRPELRRLLESAPGLEVVAEAGDAESAIEAVARHTPAALVLDLDRPGDISSLDTIRAVEQASPATRVIVLMTKDDARFVRHALHAGAAACILDDLPGEDLIEAVRRAATQRLARRSRSPDRRLTTSPSASSTCCGSSPWATPTPRSPHSCISRCARSRRTAPICSSKLSRPSRAELVRYALDRGLLHGTEDPPGAAGLGSPRHLTPTG